VGSTWRRAATAALLALAGCSGAAPHAAPAAPAAGRATGAGVTPARMPGCSVATAAGRRLPAGLVRLSPVPGDPFGVAVTADGRWSFVSLLGGNGAIGVFADAGSAGPRLVRRVPVGQGVGVALSPGGRYLLAAQGSGAVVVSAHAAEQGSGKAVLGTLSSPPGGDRPAGGAIEVAMSPTGEFAFVSLEGSGEIAVFSLQRAVASGFRTSGFVGDVPVGIAPVGLAVSPDGRWLYATSELRSLRPGTGGIGGTGTLSVISLRAAETGPAHAVVATVDAGCNPVRVITSADGRVVWVTARESDTLLGFSAARLRADPAHSLVARVQVGEAPVGLCMVDGGRRIVVADSNRFFQRGTTASLAVVNAAAALAGRPALAGYLRAGGFPREMALEPGGRTLLVTNFGSQQLETVNVAGLP
jgi:DNA-binding beta-propeller fold protein YncE